MKKFTLLVFYIILFSNVFLSASQNNIVNHELTVIITPKTSELEVTSVISGNIKDTFILNSNLIPQSITAGISLEKVGESSNKAPDVGMDRNDSGETKSSLETTEWKIIGDIEKNKKINISYSGIINSGMESSKEEYQRGFAQTTGTIGPMGTYLGGSTYWVPVFEDRLVTYNLTTILPKGWSSVSQGERVKSEIDKDEKLHIDTWNCDRPQEEIFLIAAKFTEYIHDMNSGIKAMAFLRTPDEGLANKYLEVTEQYMDMYQSILGDYPYTKFALVENFWETGYGMPSFTLLGEKVIRFPFILHSSYPHELLHNWWGNSVYVDFESGNWCEGITVFMADHLIKEQRGVGDEYRRSTLQKYSNVVTPQNDFPLNKFLSRSNAITEAVGYGKAMMVWQMLRRKIGDELFIKGVNLFNKDNKYKVASYTDFRIAMEEVSSLDLKPFFSQWVDRTGAPELTIKEVKTDLYAGKYRVNLTIEQSQKDEYIFNIDIPVHIATDKGIEDFVFNMNERKQSYQIQLNGKPLKLAVDPQYDIFRFLHPSEVPATLTKIWSSKKNLIILPTRVNKTQFKIYSDFANDWKKADNDEFKIILDDKIKILPTDMTCWILGFENKFADKVVVKEISKYNSTFSTDSVIIDGKQIAKKGNSFVLTLPKNDDITKQNIFIAFDNKKATAGLIRKLPHYGKYSYLAFNGDAPTNIAKGQWEVLNSPLVRYFTAKTQNLPVKLERKPLAELKPVFSEKRMMEDIRFLASKELKGRGIETPEINIAADYIKKKFKEAGLKPISKGKDGYYQHFTHSFKEKGNLNLKNVIGIIPGTDSSLKDEPVVITAHYDHLGLGWPDVRKGNEGKIHYGADDNASGIAVLIELAKSMTKTSKPKRTIVFLACTAEEAGLIGSRYFVKNIKNYFKGKIFANINLDTVGSLFDKKLLVLNGNTAKEWKFIFMGTDYTTGIKTDVITQSLDASDQVAFIEKGIPAIQLFTGATQHYHRPTDVIETLDGKGLVKVAIVTKEVVNYLADRVDPMDFTGTTKQKKSENYPKKPSTKKGGTKVSTGSVPDFSFRGEGVKLSSIISGSTGEKAGLKKNDIIIGIDGKKVTNLKDYSVLLKQYQPKDIVKLKVLRDGTEKIIKLKLGER